MPKICYTDISFTSKSIDLIENANAIIEEYQDDNLYLTLRQLYYQFVARGLLANKQPEYKRLGDIISKARLAGLVDWNAIEDRTRNLVELAHWTDPGHIITACALQFRHAKWDNQPQYCEVWIEKEALAGVIATICRDFDVPYFSCRGYVSQSEMWSAAVRLGQRRKLGQAVHIFHLGDHDPSGIDMTRDIQDRLNLFAPNCITVHRLALNADQIAKYNPPPNPAKITDSRAISYIGIYGPESWELDALEPRVIRDLIMMNVLDIRDDEIWQASVDAEDQHRNILKNVARDWRDIGWRD